MLKLTMEDALHINKYDLKALLRKRASLSTKNAFLFCPPMSNSKYNICLVAHIDIGGEHKKEKSKKICYDPKQKIYWAVKGQLGADDRAGVYALSTLWHSLPNKPYLLLTDLEETGGRGAREAVQDKHIKEILLGLDYLIELDRKGNNDAVFYNQETEKFKHVFTSHGYTESSGSFSDIKILSEELLVSSVNLSVGYYSQHTPAEHLIVEHTKQSISRVSKILQTHKNGTAYKCKKKEWPVTIYNAYDDAWPYIGEGKISKKVKKPFPLWPMHEEYSQPVSPYCVYKNTEIRYGNDGTRDCVCYYCREERTLMTLETQEIRSCPHVDKCGVDKNCTVCQM